MSKIAIITDSSSYLPKKFIDQYGIHVIPLSILWGQEALRDDVDITPEAFLKRLADDPIHPTTTQPSPEDFLAVYSKLAGDHDAIVAPLISSKLSGTVNSANSALASFDRIPVRVVDTQSTVMGLGFAVLAAARAAAEGKSLDKVQAAATAAAAQAKVLFVVDTLEYLHRGGRIGGASKLLGTTLNIKPLLHLDDGRVDSLERVRTKSKATARMLDIAAEYADDREVRVGVIHAGAPEEAAALEAKAADRLACVEHLTTKISPAISVHTGPGTIGIVVCPA